MDQKKNGAPPSTYSEQFFSSGGSGPREDAEAETERLKNRSDSPAGRVLFREEQFDREEARFERQREQLARERQAQFEQLEKERKAQIEYMQQVMKVVDQAVVSGFENLLRARQLGEIANKEPPARMSNAEGIVEIGKTLLVTVESLVTKVMERDPEARARLQNLSRQALGMPPLESSPGSVSAPAAPTELAPEHAEPAAPVKQPPPPVILGEVVAALKTLKQERLAELAAQHGCSPDELPVDVLLAAARAQPMEEGGAP